LFDLAAKIQIIFRINLFSYAFFVSLPANYRYDPIFTNGLNNIKFRIMTKKVLFGAAIAVLTLTSCYNGNQQVASSTSLDEVLTSRRSVRNYDASKKISEAEVRELITAAQEAPSWANQQPTKYYVAISEEKLAAVQDMVGGNKDRIKDAPVLIVSTFERGKSGFFQGNQTNEVGDGWGAYDNGLSNCYLILKARAMGFDTLIMGMREADKLRELFAIPESETIMAVISLGYRAEEPNRPERKPLDEIVKFY
jgi:nitroreductase